MSGRITDRPLFSHPPEGIPFGILAIASSLGGVTALSELLAGLTADFPVPILVCQHMLRGTRSVLVDVLARHTKLQVVTAANGDVPAPGTVHVAAPDHHLQVGVDGLLELSERERVNFCRPSADVLFRSIAKLYGPRALAVVLTGRGRDGAQGIVAIRRRGGFAIAQDEASAEAFDMPRAARDIGQADLVLPLRQIADAVQILTTDDDLVLS